MGILQTLFGPDYYEVAQDAPFVKTVPLTAEPLMGYGVAYKWVLSYLIRVRDMGTATYIGIGNETSQQFRLTIVGETYGYSANPKEAFDLSRVWVISDTADAVIECTALYVPEPMQGDILPVNRSLF